MASDTPARDISVAFLAGQFFPLQGGLEVATLREARALRTSGIEVRVITFRLQSQWPASDVVQGVPVRRIGGVLVRGKLRTRYGARWVSEALVFAELVRRRRTYDVIHLRHL